MSEAVSALGGIRSEGTIAVVDRGATGMVTLRGDLDAIAGAVRQATGLDVPGTWQASFGEDGGAVVWMAPDELLIVTDYDAVDGIAQTLGEAFTGTHHLALNVSDARVVLRLEGTRVAEVLAKGAPVDLSESAFPVGSARRTHLGGIAVGFWRRDAETWEIVAFRSFGQHLYDWLVEQSRPGSEVF